jgi:transcription initiation factor TFIIB
MGSEQTAYLNKGIPLPAVEDSIRKCPVCNRLNVVTDLDTGEIVCRDCGFVHSNEIMDRGQERSAFTLKEKNTRVRTGPPLTLIIHDQGLSSSISNQNLDYFGRSIKLDKRIKFSRLRKWDKRSKINSCSNYNLIKALGLIEQLGNKLNVPRIVTENAAHVFRQIAKTKATRGRTIKNLVAASLYIGCRLCNVPKNLADISEVSDISIKEVARNYRFIHDLLNQNIPNYRTGNIVSMLVNRLNLPGSIERIALDTMNNAFELKITSGKSPSSIAAAAVYIGCRIMGEKVTQATIASIAKVTTVTIRNRYKEMVKLLEIDVLL